MTRSLGPCPLILHPPSGWAAGPGAPAVALYRRLCNSLLRNPSTPNRPQRPPTAPNGPSPPCSAHGMAWLRPGVGVAFWSARGFGTGWLAELMPLRLRAIFPGCRLPACISLKVPLARPCRAASLVVGPLFDEHFPLGFLPTTYHLLACVPSVVLTSHLLGLDLASRLSPSIYQSYSPPRQIRHRRSRLSPVSSPPCVGLRSVFMSVQRENAPCSRSGSRVTSHETENCAPR